MFSNIGLDRWHVANKHIYNYNFCVFLCVLTDFDVLYLNLLVLFILKNSIAWRLCFLFVGNTSWFIWFIIDL